MTLSVDPAIESFCGSKTRLLTFGVLASAEAPTTGYRVALIAGLPREKVYPVLREGGATGAIRKLETGFILVDLGLRQLLVERVKVTFDSAWERPGNTSSRPGEEELREIRRLTRKLRLYDPNNRIPESALLELERDPGKNKALRRLGRRPSRRKDPRTRLRRPGPCSPRVPRTGG